VREKIETILKRIQRRSEGWENRLQGWGATFGMEFRVLRRRGEEWGRVGSAGSATRKPEYGQRIRKKRQEELGRVSRGRNLNRGLTLCVYMSLPSKPGPLIVLLRGAVSTGCNGVEWLDAFGVATAPVGRLRPCW
jgi:hypothetical protein